MKKVGLSGTALKALALVLMTVDHVGMLLFPQYPVFRIIGRLAFPIFAYMIAEGCAHTRSLLRYWGSITLVAAVCQAVYFVAMGSLYQCVLVSFSMAVALIALVRIGQKGNSLLSWLPALLGLGFVLFVSLWLPGLLTDTDFALDYGFWGVMLPVAVYLGKNKWQKLLLGGTVLLFLAFASAPVQYYALLSLPILALYNGRRGRGLGKYFFYFYYPLHLVVLEGLSYIL